MHGQAVSPGRECLMGWIAPAQQLDGTASAGFALECEQGRAFFRQSPMKGTSQDVAPFRKSFGGACLIRQE